VGVWLGAVPTLAALVLASSGGQMAAVSALTFVLLAAFGYSHGLGGRPWKRIFLLKTVVAVSGWVCLTVLFPVLNAPPGMQLSDLTLAHWAAVLWVAGFFAVGETGSDIKDIAADSSVGGKTTATTLGSGGAVAVAIGLSLPGLAAIATLIVTEQLTPWFWFMAASPTVLAAVFALSWFGGARSAIRSLAQCVAARPVGTSVACGAVGGGDLAWRVRRGANSACLHPAPSV